MASITIGKNLPSLRAQRILNSNVEAGNSSLRKISSGQRINRASDDAAGLSVADTLRSKSKLYSAAARNINDGISATNLISSALSEQTKIIFRLKELAEQSANGVYSTTQRSALNTEYQALVSEFGRIGSTTTFNNQNLLLGTRGDSSGNLDIQAGIDGQNNARINFTIGDTGALGGTVNLNSLSASESRLLTYVAANMGSSIELTKAEIFQNLGTIAFEALATNSSGQSRNMLMLVNSVAGTNNLSVFGLLQSTTDPTKYGAALTIDDAILIVGGNVLFDSNGDPTSATNTSIVQDGYTYSMDARGLKVASTSLPTKSSTSVLEFTGVETQGRSQDAISVLDNRLNELLSMQGQVGSTQSRLESAVRIAFTGHNGAKSAESRIRDTDIASEAANLIKSQILTQTGAAILAQINQQPALVLSLL